MSYCNLTKLAYNENFADTVAQGVGTSILGAGAGALLAQHGKASKLRELREKVDTLRTNAHHRISRIADEINDYKHDTAKGVYDTDLNLASQKEQIAYHGNQVKKNPGDKLSQNALDTAKNGLQSRIMHSENNQQRRARYVKKLEDSIQDVHTTTKKQISDLKDDFNKLYNDKTRRMALGGLGIGGLGYGAYKTYQHYKNKPMSKTASDDNRETPLGIAAKGTGVGLIAGGLGNYIGQTLGDKHRLRDMKNLDYDIGIASSPFQRKIDFNEERIKQVQGSGSAFTDELGPKQRSQGYKQLRNVLNGLKEKALLEPNSDAGARAAKVEEELRKLVAEGKARAWGKKILRDVSQEVEKENKVLTAGKAKAIQDVTDQFNKKHQDITANARRLGRRIGAGVGLGTYGAYKAYQHFKNRNKEN